MDFAFDDEQELFKRSARKFLETYCDKSMVSDLESSETGFDPEIWKGMAELGWMGTIVPEEYGGLACSLVELAVLFEEIGRAAMPGPMLSTVMGTLAILEAGTEEQKTDLLPKIAGGEWVLSLAVEEPHVNYDMKGVSVQALSKDNLYVISGTKLFVPYATVASHLLIAARTSGTAGEEDGITIFLVDGKSAGIRFSPMKTIAADKQFRVDFDDVPVPAEKALNTAYRLALESIIESIGETPSGPLGALLKEAHEALGELA